MLIPANQPQNGLLFGEATLLVCAFAVWVTLFALYFFIKGFAEGTRKQFLEKCEVYLAANRYSLHLGINFVFWAVIPFAPVAFLSQFALLANVGLDDQAVRQFFILVSGGALAIHIYLLTKFGKVILGYYSKYLPKAADDATEEEKAGGGL